MTDEGTVRAQRDDYMADLARKIIERDAARADLDATRFDLDTLRAAVERVRDLHHPFGSYGRCRCHDGDTYPCPTLRALDGPWPDA